VFYAVDYYKEAMFLLFLENKVSLFSTVSLTFLSLQVSCFEWQLDVAVTNWKKQQECALSNT
jgi:hypothetical protein